MHSALPEINELLIDHPNVRLALSGYNHVRDDITYNKVRFACGGAVSGNWSDEVDPGYRDTPAGIAIVDLHRDGSAEIGYFSYRDVGAREVSADGPARPWAPSTGNVRPLTYRIQAHLSTPPDSGNQPDEASRWDEDGGLMRALEEHARRPEAGSRPPEPAPDALELLKLQRSAGNRAVGRLIAERRAQSARRLDRRLGFEAEFSVPTMPPPPSAATPVFTNQPVPPGGAPPTAAIEGFLRKGLPYGESTPLGGMGTHFQLKADHNQLQSRHSAIWHKLGSMRLVIPEKLDPMSNLEYVTPAIDELAPNAMTTFNQQFAAIKAHADAVFATAQTQMNPIGPPAAGAYSGIPEQDFKNWLGTRYGEVEGEINAFKAATKNEFYLQATAGIIPSAIPDLFKARHTMFRPDDVHEAAATAVHNTIRDLEADERFAKHPWVTDLKANHSVDYEAFRGVVYLAFSYMVGQMINQTNLYDGASEKNAVPFMSKLTNLSAMHLALPPHIRAAGVPDDMIFIIQTILHPSPYATLDYWKTTWQLQDTAADRGAVVEQDVLRQLLTGAPVTAMGTHESRTFAAPEAMPAAVTAASGQQSGVQLEYRRIRERPNSAALADALKKVIEEVRDVNARHLGFFAKRSLINAADK